MKTLSIPINELKFINEFFDNEMCLCGGIADYIYVGYKDISDIDIVVTESAFMRSLDINFIQNTTIIKKYNFDIQKIEGSFFCELAPHEYFFAGVYKNYPVDLFIVKNITESVICRSKHINKKYGIKIVGLENRIQQCSNFLSAKKNTNNSESAKKWLEKKQHQAKIKLELYQKLYPKIYNDLFYL